MGTLPVSATAEDARQRFHSVHSGDPRTYVPGHVPQAVEWTTRSSFAQRNITLSNLDDPQKHKAERKKPGTKKPYDYVL